MSEWKALLTSAKKTTAQRVSEKLKDSDTASSTKEQLRHFLAVQRRQHLCHNDVNSVCKRVPQLAEPVGQPAKFCFCVIFLLLPT
jgi:hypothetical protein